MTAFTRHFFKENSLMERQKVVYLIPGMASSSKIFKNLNWGKTFSFIYLDWIEPLPNESIEAYALRISRNISHPSPILLGVSFGGIIAQEIAQHINTEKVIILSSAKSHKEFSLKIHLIRYFHLHKLLSCVFLFLIEHQNLIFINKIRRRFKIYQKYLGLHSKQYLQWSLKTISHWKAKENIQVIHIQGDNDLIFPIKNDPNIWYVPNATHLMILFRYRWINENIPKIITKTIQK